MKLTDLPPELLELVAEHSLPEGFESLALSSMYLHTICAPFIEHHNYLRRHYKTFSYMRSANQRRGPKIPIRTAFELIATIALEPNIGRYICALNMHLDGWRLIPPTTRWVTSRHCEGPVAKLFESSGYLRDCGLDWKSYYDDLVNKPPTIRYSQRAAIFLLTLLPNLKMLTMPCLWRIEDADDQKLLDLVYRRASQTTLDNRDSSLVRLSHIRWYCNPNAKQHPHVAAPDFSMDAMKPFSQFHGIHNCRISGWRVLPPVHEPLDWSSLMTLVLTYCLIDTAGIVGLLASTPRLKHLSYNHWPLVSSEQTERRWDVCGFVTAVADTAGEHLEELSVTCADQRAAFAPGRASAHGFQTLYQLTIDLNFMSSVPDPSFEALPAHTGSTSCTSSVEFHRLDYLSLIPHTVRELNLASPGNLRIAERALQALDTLRDIYAKHVLAHFESLETVFLLYPRTADIAFDRRCEEIADSTKDADIAVRLKRVTTLL